MTRHSTVSARSVRGFAACAGPALALLLAALPNAAIAKGPAVVVAPVTSTGLASPAPILPTPTFSTAIGKIHGFDVVGFIQDATVSNARCPSIQDKSLWGGSLTVNGIKITVPCNLTLQMPAATFTWADIFDPTKFTTKGTPGILKLSSSGSGAGTSGSPFPSTEVTVTGNIVDGEYIAGLILVSQQALNATSGYVKSIDYANGALYVAASPSAAATTYVQINDPTARFSIGKSPDTRFSVDDQNPTVRASTGYPMCIPRVAPPAIDAKCPLRNRPLAPSCRAFRDIGLVLPSGRDLAPPAPGQVYCSGFIMPAARSATDPATGPNPYLQAPFMVGDAITFGGTLMRGAGPGGTDFMSAHTITANVGIYTEPNTVPSYIAIDSVLVGPDALATFNGIPQEPADRFVAEASVTDVRSIVDFYLMDADPVTGAVVNRWITPYAMTGGAGGVGSDGSFIDGGITTQFVGPVPGRVRIRANRAPVGVLVSPTRYVRAVMRSLCDPANINGKALPLAAAAGAQPVDCLKRAKVANELYSGQYFAPVFEFIFPENVVPGDPLVPYNFWSLNFLISGEGPGTGPLVPRPW